jgi:hypothetical protein
MGVLQDYATLSERGVKGATYFWRDAKAELCNADRAGCEGSNIFLAGGRGGPLLLGSVVGRPYRLADKQPHRLRTRS